MPRPIPADLRIAHALISQNHIPCEVVSDEALKSRLPTYDLVILPETRLLAPGTAAAIEQYANDGGRVLIIGLPPVVAEPTAVGADSPRLFGLAGTMSDRIERHFADDRLTHVGHMIQTAGDSQVIWRRIEVDGRPGEPLLVRGRGHVYWLLCDAVSECGGGAGPSESVEQVLAAFNFGAARPAAAGPATPARAQGLAQMDYDNRPYRDDPVTQPAMFHPHLRRLVGQAVREALGDRWLIRSEAPPSVEFVVNRRGSDLLVHLVNHTGGATSASPASVTDCVPVLADVTFEVRLESPPRTIEALPTGESANWKRTAAGYRVRLTRLHYHATIRFRYDS